ncbi:baseplate J/gp47 family protein, partial [Burkholderia sp. SIMBA_042]|uniref:baseplate J/gp47 family protein n=1 Tax=Burkholderia sp. SIMBA_042 TaxID=3085783 RepID=UPI00397CC810
MSIDVYITDSQRQPASAELAQQVELRLKEKRRALHDLKVLPAKIFEIDITVKLVLREGAVINRVKDAITSQINAYLQGRSRIV